MTRINVIPPHELWTKHLVAEYRELPRVFALVHAAVVRGETPDDSRNPSSYTLGTGHVRFFYPRLNFLATRHELLVQEMVRRKYNPTFTTSLKDSWYSKIPERWWGNWTPDETAVSINIKRIAERRKE